MRDCRNCKFNSYISDPNIDDFVSCCHPVTIAKSPKWKDGDPAWVNMMTGDLPISRIHDIADCPTWERH